MSLRTENISLNCKKAYFQTIIENLHVGDVKSTQLVFTLTDGIKEIELPDGKTTAIIHGKKPDGTEIHNVCTVENNKIYYTLTAQDTAVSGIVDYMLDVTVNRDENYERAYTPTFRTRVSDRIYSPAYRVLDTEPENWETEYKNYYRKEGNAYIQIADNVCPTFAPGTFYVLVDPPVESASEFLAFYSAFNKVSELFDKRLVIDYTTTDIEYSPDNIHKVFIYATIIGNIKGIVFTDINSKQYAICSDGLLRIRTYSGSYSDWSVVALNTSIDDTNKNENNRVPSIKAVVDYIATAISNKADADDVNAALAAKANKTYVDTELGKKADINHSHPVDNEFSQTSTNPVQNKTVTEKFNIVINNVNTALAGKANVNHTHDMSNYVTLQAMIAALASKADISDIPTVPTNVSAFNNDAGYITSSDIDLSGKANYREVKIENINNATNPNTVYRVSLGTKDGLPEYATIICPRSGDLSNLNHTQYAFTNLGRVLIRKCINGVWESSFTDLIPEGADVSGKADKSYVDAELAKKADKSTTLAGYRITDAYSKAELSIKSAKSYGAKGDGVTDDTTALQTWLNDVALNGGIAYLPHGQYKITAPIVVDWSHHGGNPRNFLQRLIGDGCTSYESGYDNSCIVAYNIGANRGALEFISDGNTWGTQVQISDIGIYCESSCDPMSFCLFYGDSRHLALNRVKMKGYNDILVRCGSKVVDSSGKVTDSYEHICCTIEHCDLITRGTKGFSLLPESVLVPKAASMLDTLSLRDSFIGGVFTVHCNNFSAESCTVTIAGMKDKLNTVVDENMGKFNGYQIDYATGFFIIETASTIIKNTYFEDYKRAIDIAPICGNIRNVLIEGCYFNPGSNQVGSDDKSIESDYGILIRKGKSGAKVVYTEISHNVFRHVHETNSRVVFAVAAIRNEASEKLLCYANAGRPDDEADQIESPYGEFITERKLVNPTKTSELINDSGFITKSECNSIWKTTVAPTEPAAPEKPGYGFTISNLTGADRDVQIGDMILYSYYYYTVTDIIDSVAYAESRVSIRGAKGATYTLTAQDKTDIANIVLGELPTTEGVLYGNQSN